jgi:phage virion morphogenesis protein
MSVEFRLETSGALAIERALAGLVMRFDDIEPLMSGIGVYLEGATIERFDTQSAPDGSRWSPSLRARTEGGKTLTDTSQLRSSITSEADSNSVAVGTNKIYAGIHQFGGTIRAKSAAGLRFQLPGGLGFRRVMAVEMPARPFLGLSSEDETEILAQVEDYARDAAGGAL